MTTDQRNQIVTDNLFRVAAIAGKYCRKNPKASYDDCYQSGVLGLIYAVDHFNPPEGFPWPSCADGWPSYATHWIRGYITSKWDKNDRLLLNKSRKPNRVEPVVLSQDMDLLTEYDSGFDAVEEKDWMDSMRKELQSIISILNLNKRERDTLEFLATDFNYTHAGKHLHLRTSSMRASIFKILDRIREAHKRKRKKT